MQFDSSIMIFLIINLTLILALSCISIKLNQSIYYCVKYADNDLSSCLRNSAAPKNLQIKKHLIVRRKIKSAPDDDSPCLNLLVL